ncbi:hypothetical protein ACHAW5_010008 [Stephanodiscus triporus]|uniref:Uncharacterized protein n=1 Tax=Stephanodiscus triporus TaxID=2934178 RepID=A0ABD3NIV6_9STRA
MMRHQKKRKFPKSAGSSGGRPVHPAFVTTFGPGRGSGSSELSAWAYLSRPRPRHHRPGEVEFEDEDEDDEGGTRHLPNLVTAHSNSLRIYTVLPHAGTLALAAVYDNLAGTIASGGGRRRRARPDLLVEGGVRALRPSPVVPRREGARRSQLRVVVVICRRRSDDGVGVEQGRDEGEPARDDDNDRGIGIVLREPRDRRRR